MISTPSATVNNKHLTDATRPHVDVASIYMKHVREVDEQTLRLALLLSAKIWTFHTKTVNAFDSLHVAFSGRIIYKGHTLSSARHDIMQF